MGVTATRVVKFIRKGETGDPAITYRIQVVSATASVDANNVLHGAVTWNVIKTVSGEDTLVSVDTGTHQCKLSSKSTWDAAGNNGAYLLDDDLISGKSWTEEGSPVGLDIRFVLGGYVRCTLTVPFTIYGKKGDTGQSSFKSTCFIRTNVNLTTRPTGGSYSSPIPTSTVNDNGSTLYWSDGIPSGEKKLWAVTRIFSSDGQSPQQANWSLPRPMTDTATYDVEFAKMQTNDATPAYPTDANRHGGSGTQVWFDPVDDSTQDFTLMYWRAERVKENGVWSDWTIVRIKGETGDKGDKGDKGDTGQSSFKSACFIRTNVNLTTRPTGGSYSSPIPTSTVNDNGSTLYWSDGIPSGEKKLWAVTRIFSSDGQSPQQANWSLPRPMTDTATYDVEFAKMQTNDATPAYPTDANRHGGSGTQVWFDPVDDSTQDFTLMYWRAERVKENGVWSDWTIVRIKGETGDKGDKGDKGDTTGVNPNILLRTIFDNGINPVKQAWDANWDYVGIDGATDTVVQGRKCIRIDASSISYDLDFKQNVYGRIKANTWYTLSFNYFSTAAWHFFIYNETGSTSVIDLSAGYIVDGEPVSISRVDDYLNFAGNWQGKRHTITFKTRSSFSNAYAWILFRAPAGCQLAICMPKLEEGENATAYVAHEDDLKGADGSSITGPRGYRGPGLRGPQDWNIMEVGYQFYKGDADVIEPYEDFVVYNGNYYKCIKSHTKTATNYPGSTYDANNGLWQLSDKLAMVAANVLFAPHGYFGSAIISGDWMISTNGTIDGVAYNNGATYNGIIAYSLFNPNNPAGNTITKHNSTATVSFGSSDTIKLLNSNTIYLESGKVYFVQATGRLGSSSGSAYVRLRNTSTGATYTPVMINGTSDVTRSGLINVTVTGNYYIEIYNSGGYTGQVSASKVIEKNFAPVFALDLLTGATYQGNANLKGNFTSENKTQGNTIRIDTQNGDFTMIGPQSVNDDDRLPSSDARRELAKILFATDPDALTRLAYMWLKNGADNKIVNADPYYGVSVQDNILGDNRGAGFDADSFAISSGSGSNYREIYIDKYGVSLQIGVGSSATTKYKTWEQLLA